VNIIADNQWCELEMEMNRLYHQAVEQVPTGECYVLKLDVKHLLFGIVTRTGILVHNYVSACGVKCTRDPQQ